jgi:hypothetical protein
MPQFDKITFFTQIFWLTLIFFGFYFYILQGFLPKLASVLKSRKKKLWLSSSKVSSLGEEQFTVLNARNLFLRNFIEKNKNKLDVKFLLSSVWLTFRLSKLVKDKFENSNWQFLETCGNSFVQSMKSFEVISSKNL